MCESCVLLFTDDWSYHRMCGNCGGKVFGTGKENLHKNWSKFSTKSKKLLGSEELEFKTAGFVILYVVS